MAAIRALFEAAFSGLLGTAGVAEVPACTSQGCSSFAACVPDTRELIVGTSFGRDSGPIYAKSDSGTFCTGDWRRTVMGIGVAQFTCDDGRQGQAVYTWLDPDTGTATGTGRFNNGTLVRFWSGNDLARYFSSADPADLAVADCTPAELFMS